MFYSILVFFLEKESVIVGDGSYKLATVFNDQLPGPPIVVYQGQQVSLSKAIDIGFQIQFRLYPHKIS